jgi:hypothetical protein
MIKSALLNADDGADTMLAYLWTYENLAAWLNTKATWGQSKLTCVAPVHWVA